MGVYEGLIDRTEVAGVDAVANTVVALVSFAYIHDSDGYLP
jgi:hypothetical protein